MAGWSRGLASMGLCSEMCLPALWSDCLKKCSYGVNKEVSLRGLTRVIVSCIRPYMCSFFRILRAYAVCRFLRLKSRVCSL